MIPLNKPGKIACFVGDSYLEEHFGKFYHYWFSSAGDGLNITYEYLRNQYGSCRIGVSPLVCFLAIEPIVRNGHIPVFLDIDPNTFNMDSRLLVSKSQDIDAVEVVHLGGNPNEMDVITSWARNNNKIIIEDCAQALGSKYDDVEMGAFGDFSCYSMMKNLYAPVGGLLLSKEIIEMDTLPVAPRRLVEYRVFKKFLESHANHHAVSLWNWVYYWLLKLKGNNASYSSIQYELSIKMKDQLGCMLPSIYELNRLRQKHSCFMSERINPRRFFIQKEPPKGESNRNRLLIKTMDKEAKNIIKYMRKNGIAANNLTQSYLNPFQPHISQDRILGEYYSSSQLKNYDEIFDSLFAIPCSPFLMEKEMVYIVNKLNSYYQ